jgi:hypothetical protein
VGWNVQHLVFGECHLNVVHDRVLHGISLLGKLNGREV